MGVDVMHMNLHKTFSTPHGGGGPGAGPGRRAEKLVPFLPRPTVERRTDGTFLLDFDRPNSIGRMRAFYGNFGMLVRALTYIPRTATASAKWPRRGPERQLHPRGARGRLPPEVRRPVLHEVVFDDKKQAENGVPNVDIAKRLMDYGFHPPTISFPLIVHGALMIEPTETEPKPELDAFIDAMSAIARECVEEPDLVHGAPWSTPVKRVDEVAAARNLILRWTVAPRSPRIWPSRAGSEAADCGAR